MIDSVIFEICVKAGLARQPAKFFPYSCFEWPGKPARSLFSNSPGFIVHFSTAFFPDQFF